MTFKPPHSGSKSSARPHRLHSRPATHPPIYSSARVRWLQSAFSSQTQDASAEAVLANPKEGLPQPTGNKIMGLVLKKQQDRAEEINSLISEGEATRTALLRETIRRKNEADALRLKETIRRNKEYWNK